MQEQLYLAKPAVSSITIDGLIDEKEWSAAATVSDFVLNFPATDSVVLGRSEVQLSYDRDHVYIAARLYLPPEFEAYRVQSLKRDFDLTANEAFMVVLDTYADRTNGYYFEVTPYGNQGELLAANSGRFDGINQAWDSRWVARSRRWSDHWSTEIAIPFRSLRYRLNQGNWRVNFVRIDKSSNQYSSWAEVPVNFDIWDLNFTRPLQFSDGLPLSKNAPQVIPSLALRAEEEAEDQTSQSEIIPSVDLKLNLGQSLNLDLTINPDFSQTDVDEQQVNIGRFELFFKERRQFFLENEDLFSSYGFIPVRPFFSRRIGLSLDPGTGTYQNVPLLGGLKLSGKTSARSRLGLLMVQAASVPDFFKTDASGNGEDLPAINYSVLAFQQQLFSRSNLKLMLVNKQVLGEHHSPVNDFNRTLSLQYNFASTNGRFYGWTFGSKTLSPGPGGNGHAFGTSMVYNHPSWRILFSSRKIEDDYNAEVGFVRRTGVSEFFINPAWRYYPKKRFAESRIGWRAVFFQDQSFNNVDRALSLYHQAFLKTGHVFTVTYSWKSTMLRADFDPSRSDGLPLMDGSRFNYQDFELSFESNQRARFWYEIEALAGQYFNGKRYQLSTILNWRYQPFLNLSLRLSHNQVVLPSPFSSSVFNVITPAIRTTLSRSLFINLLAQYNQQFNNVNVNFRLQWRFKSLSDLFLIYSSNHFPDGLGLKQKAITMKITYLL